MGIKVKHAMLDIVFFLACRFISLKQGVHRDKS